MGLVKRKAIFASALLTGTLVQAPVQAQTLDSLLSNIDFTFSGYGTIGTVRTNSNDSQFTRGTQDNGASKSFDERPDSNLGLQATARFTPWLAITAQVLEDNDDLTDIVSWAYVKLDPINNLSFKLGRVEIPLFAVSESRDINYANVWLRPPNEVYAMANIEELDGAEATYTRNIGSTRLSLTGYVGDSMLAVSETQQYHAWDVHGGVLSWETPWVTLRGSLTTSETDISPGVHDKYTFEDLGIIVDHGRIIAQAEFVRRYDKNSASLVDANGWYVFGGYRFGTLVPYASFAATIKSKPYDNDASVSGDQSTEALGVRWDAFKSADLKLQVERVDPRGSFGISFVNEGPNFGHSDVTAFSLTLDFVF
jgi:hypothetical protein